MAFLMSALAGCFAVIQAGTNKIISQHWGFASALLLNGTVFLVFNLILFAIIWWQPKFFPADFVIQGRLTDMKLWWVIPGLCGFMLVSGLVISISRIGALQTFVICIASQIFCGLLWDMLVEDKTVTALRLVGATFTLLGAVITAMS